ncbi:cytochrome P450 monooxygenase-like protein [Amniculicola lignicola CBS 123094]|uniref:Cytochrome P450 monooxygenase-like protein n=1 Tax=Amniculicola lignicola CBS 123094 TaxID=1392246 RepID=A0A6A5X459_9PLEO|nr:cytochrome P450 monooxygenase-like protein [Amniculicola lignicola CBS 123094]
MTFKLILGAFAVIVLYHLINRGRSLHRNLTAAKSSGLPVVITPWNVYSVFWLASYIVWLPLLRKLPASCRGTWLEVLDPEWAYRIGYKIFEDVGSDVFLVVSPSSIGSFVADAEVMTQITSRRGDFPKPLEMYRRLEIYGKSLVSSEGAAWRMHRKLTAPSFGEKNNELVFHESLHHAQSLLNLWTGPGGRGNRTIKDPAADAMRFALYVISRAGFDVRVAWPHEEKDQEGQLEASKQKDSMFVASTPPPGYEMNYREALSCLLENIMWTQMAPPEYLTKSPIKVHRDVGKAVIEWGKYMDELYEQKKKEVASGQSAEGMDLFGALIRGSEVLNEETTEIEKSDILGNAFVIMLAGHETTANALHFALLLLALNWKSQVRLQEDLDKVLAGKPISEWTYEEDVPKLFSSMPTAVMNETLRVLQPVINIPKSTAPGNPQKINMNGQSYIMPGGTHISLCCAVHKNPKYWPEEPNLFRPERWLTDSKFPNSSIDIKPDDADLHAPPGADISGNLFKPVKGSYIPFSEGSRSCIGKRFAQVEIVTALAVIFRTYSVELAVDEYATDAEVERLEKGGKERREIWQKAADRAEYLLRDTMSSIITLQLRGVTIPIRVVRRGEERFAFG